MNVIFLTLIDINDINDRGIYHDLLRKFRDEGHCVYIISPSERRQNKSTSLIESNGVHLLKVRTLNIQKANIVEKGIGTLLLEYQYLNAFKKYFSATKFDLVLYSTPPITLTKVIKYIKTRDNALSYLLLKDIFPQNAVDLGMLKKGGFLHRFFQKKEKELYRLSDYIGCMSPANVDFVLKHNPEISEEKVEVNPNSIEPVTFERAFEQVRKIRARYSIPLDVRTFVYGGNLGKPQGIDFLIQVLEDQRSNDKVFFVIVGSGTEFPVIKNWFEAERPQNALLLNSLPKQDYDELVRACDVGLIFLDRRFTIPNFPSRLLSYLENKMPVLAATDRNTDIGRIIEDANAGFGVKSGDVVTFRNRAERLAERQTIDEMGRNAHDLLLKQYTVEISYNTILQKKKLEKPVLR